MRITNDLRHEALVDKQLRRSRVKRTPDTVDSKGEDVEQLRTSNIDPRHEELVNFADLNNENSIKEEEHHSKHRPSARRAS